MNGNKENILRQIASGLGYADSANLLEILDILLSEEQARWIAALPATSRQLAERVDGDEEYIAAGLDELFMRGLVFITEHTDHGPRYVADQSATHLMDMILYDPRYKRLGTHFVDLWRDFYNDELVHAPRSPEKMHFRILPVGEKIDDDCCILPHERVSEILRQARRIAVQPCPCRVRERACDTPLETCISLDRAADYFISRQIGREIGVEDALVILRQAEELGLVHETENIDHPTVICNCCPCCCVFLRAITRYKKQHVVARSRYCAVIDSEKCALCETCLGRCHFDAIRREEDGLVVDRESCFGCGLCVTTCSNNAITMIEVRKPEHIPSEGYTFMAGKDNVPIAQGGGERQS